MTPCARLARVLVEQETGLRTGSHNKRLKQVAGAVCLWAPEITKPRPPLLSHGVSREGQEQ